MGCQMNKRETNSDHEMLIFNCVFCLKILFSREQKQGGKLTELNLFQDTNYGDIFLIVAKINEKEHLYIYKLKPNVKMI